MFHRALVLSAAFVLLSFSGLANAQSFPSENNLMRLPNDSAPGDLSQSSPSLSQGSITGSVRTEDNNPINDARIEIRNIQNGTTAAYGYTGIAGGFKVQNLPQGTYEVVATSGLSEAHEQVQMEGMPVQLTLRIPHTHTIASGGQKTVSVQELNVPRKAKDAFRKAQESFTKGNMDQARKGIAKALSIEPKYSDAITLRAIMELQAGDIPTASNDLQQAIQIDNNNALAYIAMGSLYNTQNRFDDALRELERAETLNPAAWQVHFEISKTKLGKGDFTTALQEADKAQLLLRRDFGPLHVIRGQAFMGMKSYANAAAEFQKFLDQDKDSPAAPEVKEMMQHAKVSAEALKQP